MMRRFPLTLKIARLQLAFCAVLLAVPLALALYRGVEGVGDSAYVAFHAADLLVGSHEMPNYFAPGQPGLPSPLWTLILCIWVAIGLPLPMTSLVTGALAWGIACIFVYAIFSGVQMRAGGTVAALVLACSPMSVAPTVLASEIPWLMCVAWGAVWCTANSCWRAQTVLLVLLLLLQITPFTLSATLLLLSLRLRAGGGFPWVERMTVACALTLRVVLASSGAIASPSPVDQVPAWLASANDLLGESEFSQIGVVFVAVGLIRLTSANRWWWGLFLGGATLLSPPTITDALVYSMFVGLSGIGVEVVTCWLDGRVRIGRDALTLFVGVVAFGLLMMPQTVSLIRSLCVDTSSYYRLEDQAAAWVRSSVSPDESVMGSARMGYLVGHPSLIYAGRVRDVTTQSALLEYLRSTPPAYSVSYRSLAWDDLLHTGWFQNTYYAAAQFTTHYEPLSPITVWRRRPDTFDLGPHNLLSVRLPDGTFWVGRTYAPDRIMPGQAVSATLFVHDPPTTVAVPAGVTGGKVVVYLRSPGEGEEISRSEELVDRRLALKDGGVGMVWAETYVVSTPQDLPVGAYYLSASVVDQQSGGFAHLYQDEITFPIDRVTLGYVVVPWQGDLSDVVPVGARFGFGPAAAYPVTLLGYETRGDAVPGGTFDVTLYWEATQAMGDVSEAYFVFVHLLDSTGRLVSQHDGPPAGGRYPPQSWAPGEPVPDTHTLFLDPALPAGEYTVQVGVYTWPTFARLPTWTASDERLPDDVVRLGSVEIR